MTGFCYAACVKSPHLTFSVPIPVQVAKLKVSVKAKNRSDARPHFFPWVNITEETAGPSSVSSGGAETLVSSLWAGLRVQERSPEGHVDIQNLEAGDTFNLSMLIEVSASLSVFLELKAGLLSRHHATMCKARTSPLKPHHDGGGECNRAWNH